MKRILLLSAMASLLVLSAGAQEKKSQHLQSLTLMPPQVETLEMKVDAPTKAVSAPHKSSGSLDPFYRRPAGAFFSPFVVYYGAGMYSLDSEFLQVKPLNDYTFNGIVKGADENDLIEWWAYHWGEWSIVDNTTSTITLNFNEMMSEPPMFAVYQNGDYNKVSAFQYPHPFLGPYACSQPAASIFAATSLGEIYNDDGVALLLTSKTMCKGGRYGDVPTLFTRFFGPEPWGGNSYGWWFGKNASHIDGIAQAFEKPEHPYVLRNVYLQVDGYNMVVLAPVELTCKVYKLDRIPDYQETGSVTLPAEPGELVATGTATVTPTTGTAKNGLITFTLYGHNEFDPSLTFDITPTIDYPIMVCIDGYNDEGMENLVDFSAYISSDYQVDEGYGELAYVKQGTFEHRTDKNGNTILNKDGNPEKSFTGEYNWRGLNGLFGDMTMKTGLSIFIGIEHPYLVFAYRPENGVYDFPREGGQLIKNFVYGDTTYTVQGIEFVSSTPSGDGDWSLTCKGKEVPDWLEIELVDGEKDGEFNNMVTAFVTAEPLPKGVNYREAVVRFAIPGDYKDYRFIQGEKVGPVRCDVNGDGEVNIADVNCLIDIILGYKNAADFEGRADVNDDDEVNIADVNMVIAVILGII